MYKKWAVNKKNRLNKFNVVIKKETLNSNKNKQKLLKICNCVTIFYKFIFYGIL